MSKRGVKRRAWRWAIVSEVAIGLLFWCSWSGLVAEGACAPRNGCGVALAAYNVTQGDTLDTLSSRFQTTTEEALVYNSISDPNTILAGQMLYFPFSCGCVDNVLGHSFLYQVVLDDTYNRIANNKFEGLTTPDAIVEANGFTANTLINPGQYIVVPVNCSCGNPAVSPDFGLFASFSALSTDNSSTLAASFGVLNASLVEQYNPSVDWYNPLRDGEVVFLPVRNASSGFYPSYNFSGDGGGSGSSSNMSMIVGASVGGGIGLLLFILGACLFYVFCWKRQQQQPIKGSRSDREVGASGGKYSGERMLKSPSVGSSHGVSALSDFTVDKSVEYSFEELAAATNNFNVANKIGEGGYGSVYLATLRGQKLAVKRMNLQATREFLAELQVLTRVHHTNLVQLIGYCTVESLFLIYEFVENGTLDRHLHGRHNLPPLTWAARVQIALDAARGLEYIHEHTKPTYIHRDVKSSNILIDRQLHAKVADFGLTKLTESVSGSYPTRLVGTFGYMSPEYARFGDVSAKVDVYAFGVVLFEIISAKEAIVRGGSGPDPDQTGQQQRGLVTMFEEVLSVGDDALVGLIDPALDGLYPLENVWKMAQLAGSCTQENPELRPSMRTVVVALMSLSCTSQEWDMSAFGSSQAMMAISGR